MKFINGYHVSTVRKSILILKGFSKGVIEQVRRFKLLHSWTAACSDFISSDMNRSLKIVTSIKTPGSSNYTFPGTFGHWKKAMDTMVAFSSNRVQQQVFFFYNNSDQTRFPKNQYLPCPRERVETLTPCVWVFNTFHGTL